ncbi:hypothetical protein [Haloferula sp.]|uniref:hypothetical protein n=1 Tax=Haloferula sp. TaxID=2497595 RepID=UPI003C74B5F8
MIDEIRIEQVRLFELIYKRHAVCLGEHDDSGQFHNDIWHTGIYEKIVNDSGAVVSGKLSSELPVQPGGEMTIRYRQVFRRYGVSVGMTSFDRHRRALEDSHLPASIVMGWTAEVLERNSKSAAKIKRAKSGTQMQVCEEARDLRMYSALDAFVTAKLRPLDPEIYDRAAAEYVAFLKTGYAEGKLGLEAETAQISKLKRRIKDLENLVTMTKDGGALLDLQQKLKEAQQAELEIEKELKLLRRLWKLVLRFLDRLQETGKMNKLLGVVGRQAREILGLITKEVGRELPVQDKNAPER